jgi:hypothetical protein
MNTTAALTLAVFAGTVLTQSILGHLQRKQMRQIEMHRRDPSVPLKPPYSALTLWIFNNAVRLLLCGSLILDLVVLHQGLGKTSAITRSDIFGISLDLALIVGTVCLWFSHETARQSSESIRAVLSLMRDSIGVDKAAGEAVIKIFDQVDKIEERVRHLEDKS